MKYWLLTNRGKFLTNQSCAIFVLCLCYCGNGHKAKDVNRLSFYGVDIYNYVEVRIIHSVDKDIVGDLVM